MKYGFGIDVGGTTVKLAYFDENGTMLDKWEVPTDISGNGKNIARDIAASVENYLVTKQIPREDIIGLGMGVPGPVSSDGVVHTCINLGWGVLNVEQEMSALTGFPVKAGNDATVAALGEYWVGGGKGYQNMVMVTLGTGVGGGIVVEGKVLNGAHGACGEIGHMTLNRDEELTCNCGKRGCVEQYCSATGIVRTANRYLAKTDAPSVLRSKENFSCKDVFGAAAEGDAVANEILDVVLLESEPSFDFRSSVHERWEHFTPEEYPGLETPFTGALRLPQMPDAAVGQSLCLRYRGIGDFRLLAITQEVDHHGK